VAAVIAGCSSSDPLASSTARQIASEAAGNLQTSGGFTVTGKVTGTAAGDVNLTVEPGKGCEGNITQPGKGRIGLVIAGNQAWIQPTRQWLVKETGQAEGSQLAASIGNRLVSGLLTPASLGGTCTVASMTRPVTSAKNLAKKPRTSIDGQDVIPLRAGARTWYVTDTPDPKIVQISGTGRGAKSDARITYHPVTVTPPAANDTISAAQAGL